MRILCRALWEFIKAVAKLFKAFVREKIFRRKPKSKVRWEYLCLPPEHINCRCVPLPTLEPKEEPKELDWDAVANPIQDITKMRFDALGLRLVEKKKEPDK
jgi:hypothetical protein